MDFALICKYKSAEHFTRISNDIAKIFDNVLMTYNLAFVCIPDLYFMLMN